MSDLRFSIIAGGLLALLQAVYLLYAHGGLAGAYPLIVALLFLLSALVLPKRPANSEPRSDAALTAVLFAVGVFALTIEFLGWPLSLALSVGVVSRSMGLPWRRVGRLAAMTAVVVSALFTLLQRPVVWWPRL